MPLDPTLTTMANEPNFATLTTLFPDGRPQTQIMWVGADDEHLLINTEVHRAKFKNVQRDPRVTVTIWETGNPNRYAEARGRVTDVVYGQEARDQLDATARRYTGADYANQVVSERVLLRITPERLHTWGV